MKNYFLGFLFLMFSTLVWSQAGHIMQGIGATNMSMGGAATAQPLDINGPLQWNPAAISVFEQNQLSVNAGLFFSSPELSSTVPMPDGSLFSGVTEDDRGVSIMPAAAVVFAKADSKHTFGASAYGISGFGVTFPESMSNPINMPQSMGGFGHLESNYLLLQVGLSYAYELTEQLSIGVAPSFNYAALELSPNPLVNPSSVGYPSSDNASALGFGAQIGLFYELDSGLKLGASYKSPVYFSDFEFESTYLDGSQAPEVNFNMDYPAIYSLGLGYSTTALDFALDYRLVDYENTDGFKESGWTPTGAVAGFGWQNISILSFGVQYKGVEDLPLRLGYTYSSNPIQEELAFFSTPATAIIKHAVQLGAGYHFTDQLILNATFHYGTSADETKGNLLNPMLVSPDNPLGQIPNSEVAYEMTTSMIMLGVDYAF